MVVPAFVALKRRRLRRLLPLVPLLPLYYVLVSAAAWRAMWELIRDPFRWNKTEHGGAQTSRTGSLIAASGRSARRLNPEPAVDPAARIPGRGAPEPRTAGPLVDQSCFRSSRAISSAGRLRLSVLTNR